MKFGIRKPSLRGMVAARLSPARFGWLTNPKKAL